MNKLIAKLKISSALNDGTPLSGFWQKQVSGSPDLEQFQQSAQALDGRLKQPLAPISGETPATLHLGIMRAVRQARAEAEMDQAATMPFGVAALLRWAATAALVFLLAAGSWLALHHHSTGRPPTVANNGAAPSLPSVGPVVEQLAADGAALVSLPMNRQLEGLSRDVRETAQFLLASLP
jgi:hypothetical protein